MKKMFNTIRSCLALAFFASFFALASCTNDIDSASTTAGIDNSADDAVVLKDNDGTSDKTRRKDNGGSSSVIDFDDDFIRGFDASAVDYFEKVYATEHSDWGIVTKYSDSDGSKDIFKLLADHGFNTIRLRVWVDPTVTDIISGDSTWPTSTSVDGAWKAGDCTKERAAALAKRAKAVGMKVLLDLHLSDYWTDPAIQLIPKSWQSLETADAMQEKLSSYITETLQYMKDHSVTPDYVQVGNEIDRGILVDKNAVGGTSKSAIAAAAAITGGYQTENFKTYLKAGCAAVRDFNKDIKIIVHITAKNSDRFSYVKAAEADYDIIGLSYYSWEDHGTMADLISKIDTLKSTYGKDVMVVETSFAAKDYSSTDDNGAAFKKHMEQAATNLTGKNYSDVAITDNAVVPSEAVQKAILRHTMQEVYDAKGIGICVWGGERRDYQYGLSDWGGAVYDAIDAFNYKPAEGYSGTGGGTNSVTVTANFVKDSNSNPMTVINASDIANWNISKIVISVDDVPSGLTWASAYATPSTDAWANSTTNAKTENLQNGASTITVGSDWADGFIANTKQYGITVSGEVNFTVTITIYTESTIPYTITSIANGDFTATYTGTTDGDVFLSSSSFAGLEADGSLTIKAVWKSGANSTWIGYLKGTDWGENLVYSDSDKANVKTVKVSDVSTSGLGLKTESGAVYEITVTYTKETSGD